MNTDTTKTRADEPEQHELGTLFRRAAQLMMRGHHHHGPIHPAKGRLLALLQARSPVSQRVLMEEMGVRSGSLSELLAKLERHGLIERTRDEEDKRGFLISLTAHGDALVAEYGLREKALAEILFAPLDKEEREQLSLLLQKLIEAWEKERVESDAHPHGHRLYGEHPCMRCDDGHYGERQRPHAPGKHGHSPRHGHGGGKAAPMECDDL